MRSRTPPAQAEIDMRFTTADAHGLTNLMMYKYVVKNVARKHGMTATFHAQTVV